MNETNILTKEKTQTNILKPKGSEISQNTYSHKPAGFWVRVMANVIDAFFIAIPIALILSLVFFQDAAYWLDGNTSFAFDMTHIIVSYLVVITFWIKWKGKTVGKRVMGIKIISDNGKDLTLGRSTVRYFGYTLSAVILFLGFLIIPFRKDKRGLHDMISKTRVVYK